MKFMNQKDYPHMLYTMGAKADYEYFTDPKNIRVFSQLKSNMPINAVPGMAPATIKATVADGGCGLCCAVMAADHLIPNCDFDLVDALELSYASGGNHGYGTGYECYAPAFAEKMGLTYKPAHTLEEVDACLMTGGAVVAEVAGDLKNGHIGVFTAGAHYIMIHHKRADGKYAILDPSLLPGKYDVEGRKGLVEVDPGDGRHVMIYAAPETVMEEAHIFDVPFFCFWK